MAFMFEKLEVYQKAVTFAEQIAALTQEFPRGYGFPVDQLNRAALSIATNLAEGNGRFTKPDRKNFFMIGRAALVGSVAARLQSGGMALPRANVGRVNESIQTIQGARRVPSEHPATRSSSAPPLRAVPIVLPLSCHPPAENGRRAVPPLPGERHEKSIASHPLFCVCGEHGHSQRGHNLLSDQ